MSHLKSEKNDIGSLYDASLNAYDILYWEEQLNKYEGVFKFIQGESINILDIGVGTGRCFSKCLRKDYYLIGIDLSYLSLKRSFNRGEYLNVDLIYGDGEDPPLRLDSIDYIISITVIHHFKDPKNFISRIFNNAGRGILLSFLNKVFNKDFIDSIASKYGCISTRLGNDYLIFCKKI